MSYRNIFGLLGLRWIDEATLQTLKSLDKCYIVEVTVLGKAAMPICDVTGTERNVVNVQVYFKDKEKDKAPFYYSIEHSVGMELYHAFSRDSEIRRREKCLAPYRDVMLPERDLDPMRKQLKKRMLEVFKASFESCSEFSGDNFICHRNQYKRLGFNKMLEYIRQADGYGIDITINFNIANADADQIERTLNDLEMIDATVENEPLPSK